VFLGQFDDSRVEKRINFPENSFSPLSVRLQDLTFPNFSQISRTCVSDSMNWPISKIFPDRQYKLQDKKDPFLLMAICDYNIPTFYGLILCSIDSFPWFFGENNRNPIIEFLDGSAQNW